MIVSRHICVQVLSKAFDTSLGGRNFDKVLLKHFAAEFKTKYKIDVLSNPRAKLQLTNECEKLKKMMSANATPIPITCFMSDKGMSGRMKRLAFMSVCLSVCLSVVTNGHESLTVFLYCREDFQELCKDLIERVKSPLLTALQKSGVLHF